MGEVEQRPALAVVERAAPAPPLSAWEPEELPEACDPSPHAPRCEPDAEPVFAAPWAPRPPPRAELWTAWDDPRAAAALEADLARLLDVVARNARRPRPPFVAPRETFPVLGDVGELAGGRTGEREITFEPLETS